MRQAILAAEDAEFEHHIGIRPLRLFVTVVRNLVYERRLFYAGASTLTQQLTRKLFLKPEKTLERKVKEAVLALQIEKRYTKQEIFTLYCNQMNLGHGAYGVEAAARVYFGKPVKELNLEEAATIAGILQLPERQSPYVNQKWATQRRNYTLRRMAEEGFITQARADAAQQKPIVLAGLPGPSNTSAPYFTEEVRQHLEHQYGAQELYEAGLSVADDPRLRPPGGGGEGAGPRPSRPRQAARLPQGAEERRRRRQGAGRVQRAPLGAAHPRRRHRQRRRDGHRRRGRPSPSGRRRQGRPASRARHGARAHRQVRGRAREARVPVDGPRLGVRPDEGRRSHRGGGDGHRRAGRCRVGRARADAARRRRTARDRQPHRANPRDDRRLRLRPQQVQSGGAGPSADRLGVQAHRVRGRDRSRVYAHVDHCRCAGVVQRGARPAALCAAELRPQVRRPRHAAPRARAVAQRAHREADGPADAGAGHQLRAPTRVRVAAAAVPVHGARRLGSHAASR